MNALQELRKYVSDFSARCRSAGWFGALFHAGVISNVVDDAQAEQADAARLTYASEQEDHEAAKIIADALQDGRVTPCEIPALRRALRLVNASAAHDSAATRILSASNA